TQVREQLLGVVLAAAQVDPVSLSREPTGAVRRQLLRLLVDKPAESSIERCRSDSEYVGQRVRRRSRDDVAVGEHLELGFAERQVDADRFHRAQSERCDRNRNGRLHDRASSELAESSNEVVLRRSLSTGEVQRLAAEILALQRAGKGGGEVLVPDRLKLFRTRADRRNHGQRANHSHQYLQMLV